MVLCWKPCAGNKTGFMSTSQLCFFCKCVGNTFSHNTKGKSKLIGSCFTSLCRCIQDLCLTSFKWVVLQCNVQYITLCLGIGLLSVNHHSFCSTVTANLRRNAGTPPVYQRHLYPAVIEIVLLSITMCNINTVIMLGHCFCVCCFFICLEILLGFVFSNFLSSTYSFYMNAMHAIWTNNTGFN